MGYGRYDWEEVKSAALSPNATADDVDALGEWLERYDMLSFNGEYYDLGDGLRLYPVYEINDRDGDFLGFVGWEVR